MRTTARSLVFAMALGLLGAGLAAASLRETIDRTLDFHAGDELVLRNVNGPVTIDTWDRQEVRIVAVKKARSSKALEALRVEIESSAGEVEVTTRHPRESGFFDWLFGSGGSGSVAYQITLPELADVDVVTVNGTVAVEGVYGDLRLRSTNGAVKVADSGGSLRASTTNGRIEVELTALAADHDLKLSTTNGGIALALPDGLAADLSASTTNGSISTDFPVEVLGTFGRRRLDGTINGGGGRIDLSTTNGSISIRRL